MSTDHVEGVDINMGDRAPVVCVVTIYHKLGGGVLRSVLESIERLRYPREKIILLMIDNYSRDGAFEFVNGWLLERVGLYRGVVHIRARGNPARLRNVALLTAMRLGVELFSFIDSDILVDSDFLNRALETMIQYEGLKRVFSVSMVWDVGLENLDWLEKLYVKWFKGRKIVRKGVFEGEAINTSACLINLGRVCDVGFFDEDVWFIEDLDWGRRVTRKGYVCLFDDRVVLLHLRKYSLKEFRKYFMRGALAEAKLFLKNGLGWRAARRVLYWCGVLAGFSLVWVSPWPALVLAAVGYGVYFRRARGWGKLFLYPVSLPFNILKSFGLGVAMMYWVLKGGYSAERVTVLGEPDWEVVLWNVSQRST
uniref:Glycosyltransferase family 2 protein n=1 Tax=Caldiarchaeum subterraneum TaxID=311458 RepID=E6NA35_CALS0|nr:hypothetical protein HGMM_F51A06C34 [Candidatus Caldarchaeum subterraneum]